MSNEIELLLSTTERASTRDNEISRILNCHDKDYYAILDVDPLALAPDFKKVFRKKSLLIHPDKTDNKDAPRAFELLQKAYTLVSESENADVTKLLDIYKYASPLHQQSSEIRKHVAEILNEEEHHHQTEVKKQHEKEAKEKEEALQRQKDLELQRQLKSKWEDLRDARVANWRLFVSKVDKKKKKKKKVLA